LVNAAESFSGRMVGITDGDTIRVLRDGVSVPVRLDGIDAPEKKQPFGARSREFAGALAFGKVVTVETKGTDRYRRIIGRVVLNSGRVLNEEMLKAGMAWVYVKYCRDQRYYEIEAEFRNRRVGLWTDLEPVAPWEWRKPKYAR
jgi:micrococcal nuclease